MILNKKFYNEPSILQRFILTRKMRSFLRKEHFLQALALSKVSLPQYFFYSPRIKTVPHFSGNLQLLSNWQDLPKLPEVCPTKAIRVTQKTIEIDQRKCIACGLCVEVSPEGLLLTGIHDPEKKSSPEA